MLRQKLHQVLHSMLNSRLTMEEIKIVTERIYIEHKLNREIPVLQNKKIIWINIQDIYYI